MSLDFDFAPYCRGKHCTHKLTASADYKRGYCDSCWQEKQDKEKVKIRRKIENTTIINNISINDKNIF